MAQRRMWVAGGLALWISVIVVGAGARPDSSTWIGTSNVDTLLLVAACVVALAVIALLIWAGPSEGRVELSERDQSSSLATLALVALALLVWNALPEIEIAQQEEETQVPTSAAGALEPTIEDIPPPQAVVELRDLTLLFIGGAVLAAAVVIARRSRVAEPEPMRTSEDRYAEALTTARRRLEKADDPRTAVLHAYAELEEALAEIGRPRRPADTVAEHQRRVLDEEALDAEPFDALATLYRSARFSSIAIDERDRAMALAALDRSRSLIGKR